MKTYTKNQLLFLFLLLIAISLPQSVFAVHFRNLGVKDGLSQISVLSIRQDALGRMWFGTMEGLSIYNGKEMVTLKGGDPQYDQYIKNNLISDIVENTRRDIFFRADYALIRYQLDQDQFQCIRSEGVTSASSVRGKVYVSVKDSILLWDENQNCLQFFMKLGIARTLVTNVFQDRNNNWWVSTSKGLYKRVHGKWICQIPDVYVRLVYESHSGDIWVATKTAGLYRIDTKGIFTRFVYDPAHSNSICHNDVRVITEDRQGNLWIGTHKGLNKYSLKDHQFEAYIADDLPGSLRHSSVFALLMDRNGEIWVGTYYGGVSSFTPGNDVFRYYSYNSKRKDCLDFPFVGNMVEDKQHNLWICTDGGGLNFMDRQTQLFQSFNTKQSNIKADNLKCICYDSIHNKLYMGLYLGGLTCFDIRTKQFKNYLNETVKGRSHHTVLQVRMFGEQVVFLSEKGISILNPKNDEITLLAGTSGSGSFIIDSKGYLWMLRIDDVVRINMHNVKERRLYDFKTLGIGRYSPLCAYESKDGGIYIGTEGSGVLEYNPGIDHFSMYKSGKDGLLDDYCYNIAGSKQGEIIFLGNKGLSFFNPKTKKVEYVAVGAKFPVASFNDGNGLFVAENGDIFIGSTEGLIMLSEEWVHTSDKERSLFFSNILVNNMRVAPGDETGILEQIISYTKEVSLDYDENNLVFTFANNDFGNSLSPALYEYKLEGFDKEWRETEVRPLTYTNLNPGKYTLRVKEKNIYGNSSLKEIQLAIVIHSPIYDTPWAWILYVLAAITILYIIISGRQRQLRLKTSLEYEQREKEHIEELNRFKLIFFTNISHELRTPLTLIITQAEMLLNSSDMTRSVKEKVTKLYKNTFQMRNLISELLDFHKLEQGQMRLKVQAQNIIPFLNDIYSSFHEKAESLNIQYTFSSCSDMVYCCFDPEQLRKAFTNLLSNAFKFTKRQGMVELSLSEDEVGVIVRVIDNGIGIKQEDINRIFERFYQSSAQDYHYSSGIGLALCKDIIRLHHGEITAESKLGYGSIFIIRLQKGIEHFVDDPKVDILCDDHASIDSSPLPDSEFIELLQEIPSGSIEVEQNDHSYTILIVEDNEELLGLLSGVFSPLYTVLTATDGEIGLQIAMEKLPNVILSDVMMPKMDGNEMCMKVKSNLRTCHIPIILLTARTAPEQHIEGLLTGADDYITKPFNTRILLAKVNTILRNRELLQAAFRKEPESRIELLAGNELDQKLLKKVEEIVEENIEDPEFNVDQLAQLAGMGRSVFYEKMKALTGVTPANFILIFRLRKAATLLLNHPEYQVNDVAFRLGFGSGRYFSRCFKNHFNITPQQYRGKGLD